MLKKWVCCICIFLMTLTFFASVISHEAFASDNNQRWIYVTTYYVCPNGDIFTQTTSRTLKIWQEIIRRTPRDWKKSAGRFWEVGNIVSISRSTIILRILSIGIMPNITVTRKRQVVTRVVKPAQRVV